MELDHNFNNVRLVVCDIDGTLVNDARQMTPRTREAIQKLHQKGILFGLASGRPVNDLKLYQKKWELSFSFDLLIGMNGSELWDGKTKKLYSFYLLKKEWMKEIIDMMSIFDLNPFIYKDSVMMALRLDDEMKQSKARNGKEVVVVKNVSELYAEDNAKILYRIPLDRIDEIESYARRHIKNDYKVFKTQPTMIEFAHMKTDKANALKKYCELYSISPKEVVAFGDASNDEGMLQYSGIGICMQNGIETTKQISDIVLDKTNNEEGVAYCIEKNF